MEQPSSRAGTVSESLVVASAFARSARRRDRPLRILVALLIVSGLASACRRVESVAAVPAIHAAGRDIVLAADKTVVAARVASGATFASLLREQGLTATEVADMAARVAAVFDLRKVRTAQPYRFERANDGAMRLFEYEIDADWFLRLSRESAGDWLATVLPIPKTRHLETVRGTIDWQAPSLVAAVDAAGETIDLTLALAEIFGGDIDFSTELQPGDSVRADGREAVSRRRCVRRLRPDRRRRIQQPRPQGPVRCDSPTPMESRRITTSGASRCAASSWHPLSSSSPS